MAHTLYTPTQAASSVLAALRGLSVLPRTVRQDFSSEFVAGVGQTVNVLGPVTAGEAKTYTKAKRAAHEDIEFNDLGQAWISVKIEDQVYNAVRLPDDWATFTLSSLEQQVLIPQAESVVDQLAKPLVAKMEAIATDATIPKLAADGANLFAFLAAIRRVMNKRNIPTQDRTLAVGPAAAAAILQVPNLTRVNEAGNLSALAQGTIMNLFGFNIVETNDFTDESKVVAYNRDAFTLVTRASRVPEGVAHGATVSQDGFALRHIMHYSPVKLEDQSIVDAFVGAETLDARRAVSATVAAAGK